MAHYYWITKDCSSCQADAREIVRFLLEKPIFLIETGCVVPHGKLRHPAGRLQSRDSHEHSQREKPFEQPARKQQKSDYQSTPDGLAVVCISDAGSV